MKIKSPKDFWAAVMFIAFGAAAMVIALKNYQFGTAVRMGPGYFPTVLGGLMIFLGAIIMAGSLAVNGPKVPAFNFRPLLLVLAGVLAYGYLMKPLGLVLATFALVIVAGLGGHEFRIKEAVVASLVLAVFSIGVFVKGLTLPFPLCPGPLDDACQAALNFGSGQPAQPAETAEKRKKK